METKLGNANHAVDANAAVLPCLIVMPRAGTDDLFDVMNHNMNIAGRNHGVAISVIAVGVAKALRHLNDAGVMHGDVKARNFVPLKNFKGFAIVDLDAAASTTDGQSAGAKTTSSGCVPPEQAVVLRHTRSTAETSDSGGMVELKRELQDRTSSFNIANPNEAECTKQSATIQKLKRKINAQKQTPPSPVIASRRYGMWCFGVLLYELCTGKSLFHWDSSENVDDKALARMANWSDQDRQKAIEQVGRSQAWPVGLLARLLETEPANRPNCWDNVLEMLERSGVRDQPPNVVFTLFASTSKFGAGSTEESLSREIEAAQDLGRYCVADDKLGDRNLLRHEWSDVHDDLAKLVPTLQGRLRLLHFCGHGSKGTLLFEGDENKLVAPMPPCFAQHIARSQPSCVFLNACSTGLLASAINAECLEAHSCSPMVIFWETEVDAKLCERFFERFHRTVSEHGGNVVEAFELTKLCFRSVGDCVVNGQRNVVGVIRPSAGVPPSAQASTLMACLDPATRGLRIRCRLPMFNPDQTPPKKLPFTAQDWDSFVRRHADKQTKPVFFKWFDCFGENGPSREYWFQVDDDRLFDCTDTAPFVVVHVHFMGSTAKPDFDKIQSVNARWSEAGQAYYFLGYSHFYLTKMDS